ncbi:MAG: UDP-N-acetylglucosamine 2-epimerase (non-hydrolyzing), partial [Frankiaceae bacterium]|jgi:UDP-N-acetylglucosamine 2-epimerase (non-hydrolysing)|nr:UDP-N-acetylglucosamine 2-epimerase (non-hydrolyzing) [Frankiaceae bacterium]
VLVHGDTSTSTAAALAAYYHQLPIAHLEAGLRSGNLRSPYPEEGNRRLTAQLADLHLAPTAAARQNLLREQVPPAAIAVTGNTVIDALIYAVSRRPAIDDAGIRAAIRAGRRIVVVTGHRRESGGGGLGSTAGAIAEVAAAHPDITVVWPAHPNPVVRAALAPALAGSANVLVTEPLDYPQFCALLAAAHCIVTDSGGIQEEAPSLGKPVLVTRDTTERPEAISAGTARLIGTDRGAIVAELTRLLEDPEHYARMSAAVNPYGDGRATGRVIAALKHHFGLGPRLPDFDAGRGGCGPKWAFRPPP